MRIQALALETETPKGKQEKKNKGIRKNQTNEKGIKGPL